MSPFADDNIRGQKAYAEGNYARALRWHTKALMVDPNNYQLLCHRSQVFRALGEIENALADAEKASALNPEDYLSHYHVGLTYFALGKLEASKRAFARSLAREPRRIVHIRLAEVQEQLRIDAMKSLQSHPQDGSFGNHFSRGPNFGNLLIPEARSRKGSLNGPDESAPGPSEG